LGRFTGLTGVSLGRGSGLVVVSTGLFKITLDSMGVLGSSPSDALRLAGELFPPVL
jgi:hypothetical protein